MAAVISRITSSLRHVFVWSCTLLAIGVAALWVRSYWRCDEAGYYSYKPAPPPSKGRDCRNLLGCWRGGLFWVCTEADVGDVDWYGGEPAEIILHSAPRPRLFSAAMAAVVAPGSTPAPRWSRGGFDVKADSGRSPPWLRGGRWPRGNQWPSGNRWWYRCLVVPHWALFLLLAWAPAIRLRHLWILRRRRKQGLCLNCGYDVRASGAVCSECGNSLLRIEPAALSLRPRRRGRWAAVVLLVVGVVAMCLYLHRRPEPAVRLNPATALPAGNLHRHVELDLGSGVTMRFVLIPSGRFLMGSPVSEAGRKEDERQHEVTISKCFYMGITEVTQEQYEAVVGKNPSLHKGAKNPVDTVSCNEATAFCRRVSELSVQKVRLPTEAEWEYACRAGTSTPFHTGQTLPNDGANYNVGCAFPSSRQGDSEMRSFRVGSFRPNAWGLYDMHGNVFEWCSDRYDSGQKSRARGGSWWDVPGCCRAAYRDGNVPDHRDSPLGFRVCLDF